MPEFLNVTPSQWAPATNYPAGANDWNGTPTKVVPDSGTLANGVTPAQQFPAQYFNYQLGAMCTANGNLARMKAHSALQRWTRTTIPQVGTDSYYALLGLRTIRSDDANGDRQRAPVMFGLDSADSNKTRMARSNDGTVIEAAPGEISPAFTSVTYAAAGAPGEMMLGQANPNIQYSLNHGHSWAVLSLPSSGSQALAVHYAPGLARYFAAVVSGSVFTGTALSAIASWLSAALPVPGAASIASVVEFADDGGSNVCVVAKTAASTACVYLTTNAGTSWTKVLDLPSSTSANLKYSKALGCFVVWDTTGAIHTSTTGATWTLTGTAPPADGGRYTLAVAGPAIVKCCFDTLVSSEFQQRGITYSLDLGVHWNFWSFTGINVQPALAIAGFNERIYALDGTSLYVSGQLGLPLYEV